jgi:hypothetical protein
MRSFNGVMIFPQPHRIAFDLNVPLLEDVEQPDLNLPRQIRQLVDREDPAIRPRQQAVVHRQLVAETQPGARRLDRIDIAEHVRDRDIRRGELLDVARIARQPLNGQRVAFGAEARAARAADRRDRIVMNLAARHDRDRIVQEFRQRAEQPALRLAPQAEQDEVVPRQDCVRDLRDDRFVVADDPGKQRFTGAQLANQVVADFVANGTTAHAPRLDRLSQVSERGRDRHNAILALALYHEACIVPSAVRVRWSWPIAGAARSVLKIRCLPSSAAVPPALTVSRSTSAWQPMEKWWSFTTPRSIGRRMRAEASPL